MSKRIYTGTEEGFMNGGIIVSREGTILRILRSAQEVNSYLYNTESEAVCVFVNTVYKLFLVFFEAKIQILKWICTLKFC